MTHGRHSDSTVLLTGATGFVGMSVLARLLERSQRRIVALVRATDRAGAQARLRGVLGRLFGDDGAHVVRVEALPGDVTAPALGLSGATAASLAERIGAVVHCAASVSFSQPLEEARAINAEGTRSVLDLTRLAAERGGLERLVHVSTAYVAGTHEGTFREADLDVGQGFRNSYERSKHEAERLVHDRAEGIPTSIARPSIIVGERETGWTAAFNVLYWPLRAFARGLYDVVPAVPSTHVDIVPVDYVADGILALLDRPAAPARPETFHLTAGRDATTIGEVMELATDYFDREPPRVVPPGQFDRALAGRRLSATQTAALEQSAPYFPYLTMSSRFDDREARRVLEPAGLRPPPIREYFDRLMDFATAAKWGKRRIDRAAV